MTDWRAIPGFEAYEASAAGEVRPVKPRYRKGRGLVLHPWIVERHGRRSAYVTLYVGGKRVKQLVHRLVAMAWHGPPTADMRDCCHINHNSLDNRACNLRWDTHANNIAETFSEDAIMARARLDDACGLAHYSGPDSRSPIPF